MGWQYSADVLESTDICHFLIVKLIGSTITLYDNDFACHLS